jgi:hypothetical protein
MIQEIHVGPKVSSQPCCLCCLARERAGIQGTCLTKIKEWTLHTTKGEHWTGKFVKGQNESSHKKGGVWVSCQRCHVFWDFYPFSTRLCSISMPIRCGESKHSGWLCLERSDWWCPSPYTVFILVCSAFPSFHHLRSQGGHNGGFQGPFLVTQRIRTYIST